MGMNGHRFNFQHALGGWVDGAQSGCIGTL